MSGPLLLILLILAFYIIPSIGLYLLFKKAGEAGWKGLIPVYNSFVMLKISGRPWYWVLLQFIPVIGLFYTLAIGIEFIKVYGKKRFYQYVLLSLTAGFYFFYVGMKPTTAFTAPDAAQRSLRSAIPGWIGTGLIVIFSISLFRAFVVESYTLPTTSMERTLLMNDCFFVNKWSYGPRIPNTPLSIPYLPGIFPAFLKNAWSEAIKLPYGRLFQRPVERGDVVVFNLPVGDTVINLPDYQSMRPYYDVISELGRGNVDSGRQLVLSDPADYPLVTRPVDKREVYLKRCVAIPGDIIQIRDQVIYISGKAQPFPPESETICRIATTRPIDETAMKDEYGVDINNIDEFRPLPDSANQFEALLTWNAREKMLKDGFARSITPDIDSTGWFVFPYDTAHKWTRDNYGPVWIPKKGATLELTPENYSVYERVIRVYEGNKLEFKDGKFFLNDRQENKYTFKMDYYWMLGDNLHGSQDSRYWGFVPEDHVIGKAGVIWWSWNKGMRWGRIFRKIE